MKKRRQSLPTTLCSATIEKFSHDGRGIARIDGKTTFIEGALPGEQVIFQYTRKKSDFDEGKLISVEMPSSMRVDPHCAHFAMCGGCSLQHMSSLAQIHEKQNQLIDLLSRVGHCQPETILEPLVSDSWHYRNKARLSVRYVEKKQSSLVGFREKNNPRYIAELSDCPILNAKVSSQINTLRHLIDSLDDPHSIAQIEVAAGDKEIALIFRNLSSLSGSDEQKLKQFSDNTGFIIFLQPKGPDSVSLFYPSRPDAYLTYQLVVSSNKTITFQFHPTDFTQVNALLNQKMVSLALELLAPNSDDVVLDLFCGLGNFSLPIAHAAKQVVGIEGSDTMVSRASMNASLNGIKNTEFFCADLENESAFFSLLNPSHKVNKILLDPPRSGAQTIVKQMNRIMPERIVYVSCNPATLARDAGILVNEHGYRLKCAGVMDMFPQTAHVESIALFEKG